MNYIAAELYEPIARAYPNLNNVRSKYKKFEADNHYEPQRDVLAHFDEFRRMMDITKIKLDVI